MKTIFSISIVSILLVFGNCTRPDKKVPYPASEVANVSIKFINQIAGNPIVQSTTYYTNAAGNEFNVDLLKYYVTNVVLVNKNGTEVSLKNYDLIDAFNSAFSTVEATNIPNGEYTSMRFKLGVDKDRNHSGAQDGDLDPMYNMIWSWATGYIFFKHEGYFKDSNGVTVGLALHLGTDSALADVTVPIDLKVEGYARNMDIIFDLNKMYNSPKIDFDTDNNRMSTRAEDAPWIVNMVQNTNDAFLFGGVY